jgi:lysophospholipase L1-like esterase
MKLTRRDFLRASAGFLTAAALIPRQAFSFGTSAVERDLQMLILGDSVMWGQGLLDEHKFWFLTQKWLEAETGRKVVPHLEAHSGATILWRNDQKYPKDRLTNLNGELNVSTPTIAQQVKNAFKYYETTPVKAQGVDLVLVNGGINDLGAFNLINPFKSKRWIEKKARQYCGRDMLGLLENISQSFGGARIIVTGYYPVVSRNTSPEKICEIINELFNEKILGRIRRFFGLGERRLELCSFSSVNEKIRELIAELSVLSEAWQSQTNIYLRQAVDEINRKYPLNTAAGNDTRRAIFVEAPFGAPNAYAAPDTYLWQMEEGGEVFGKYKSNDKFFALRQLVCKCAHIRLEGFRQETCYIAGTAHPNIVGASKYAEAIRREFGDVLKSTGWLGGQSSSAGKT